MAITQLANASIIIGAASAVRPFTHPVHQTPTTIPKWTNAGTGTKFQLAAESGQRLRSHDDRT